MDATLDSTGLKEAFALQLLMQRGDALQAALTVCKERAYAMFIAEYWPSDLYVMQHRTALLERHGAAFFLPDRYAIASRLLDIADEAAIKDDKLRAIKLYADIMGFIEKPSVKIDQSTNVTNKVMIVKDHGSDDTWEARLREQQAKLVIDAS